MLKLTAGETELRWVRAREVALLAEVCTRPADPEWIERLSPRLRLLALVPKLREDTLDLTADPRTYELAEAVLTPLAHPDAADALAEQRLLRARLDAVPPSPSPRWGWSP